MRSCTCTTRASIRTAIERSSRKSISAMHGTAVSLTAKSFTKVRGSRQVARKEGQVHPWQQRGAGWMAVARRGTQELTDSTRCRSCCCAESGAGESCAKSTDLASARSSSLSFRPSSSLISSASKPARPNRQMQKRRSTASRIGRRANPHDPPPFTVLFVGVTMGEDGPGSNSG